MNPELLLAVALGAISVPFIVVSARRRARADASYWRSLASLLELELKGLSASGRYRGLEVWVGAAWVSVHGAKEKPGLLRSTQARVTIPTAVPKELALEPRSAIRAAMLEGHSVEPGRFDDAFLVSGASREELRRFINPAVRAAALDAIAHFSQLVIDAGVVKLSAPYQNTDVEQTREMLELAVQVARAFEEPEADA